jgi:hypothetical protein
MKPLTGREGEVEKDKDWGNYETFTSFLFIGGAVSFGAFAGNRFVKAAPGRFSERSRTSRSAW